MYNLASKIIIQVGYVLNISVITNVSEHYGLQGCDAVQLQGACRSEELAASIAASFIPRVKVACSMKTSVNCHTVKRHNPEGNVVITPVPVPQISHRKYTSLRLQIKTCHHYISPFQHPSDLRTNMTMEHGILSLLNLHILQAHIQESSTHPKPSMLLRITKSFACQQSQYGIQSSVTLTIRNTHHTCHLNSE
jgi:hypothetical protein